MTRAQHPQDDESSYRFSVAGAWGIVGISVLLGFSLYRVTPIALEPLTSGSVAWWVLGLYLVSVTFNAWMEGYRGFHLRVAPKVARRAHELSDNPGLFNTVFAPFYCAGYYSATKSALIARYVLTLSIVGIIVAMKFVPQPWRGIVDAGVVVGLSIGAVSIVYTWARSIREPEWLTGQLRAAGLLEDPDGASVSEGDDGDHQRSEHRTEDASAGDYKTTTELVPDVPAHGVR